MLGTMQHHPGPLVMAAFSLWLLLGMVEYSTWVSAFSSSSYHSSLAVQYAFQHLLALVKLLKCFNTVQFLYVSALLSSLSLLHHD